MVTIAAGDRVICRRNDNDVDVDDGTRGTVRAALEDRTEASARMPPPGKEAYA